jgi:hypothetical protein
MADNNRTGGSRSKNTNHARLMMQIALCLQELRRKFRADIKLRPEAGNLRPRRPEAG